MTDLPVLTTDRLTLRPARMEDAPVITRYLQEKEIAANTATIPYPYKLEDARTWIASQPESRDSQANFMMTLRDTKDLIGSAGLKLALDQFSAELGYWVAKPFWGRGFATEAARAVLGYGFVHLRLHRIHAHHMSRNPASGKVLEKIGMQHEGRLRDGFYKWETFQDIEMYAILAGEFKKGSGS